MKKLHEEIDQLHITNQSLKDDLVKQNLQFTRDDAIINQKIQFKDEKIEELNVQYQKMTQQYEEKITELKNELLGDMEVKLSKMEDKNKELLEKLHSKKEQVRVLENELDTLRSDTTSKELAVSKQLFTI
jgi:hypothetical protein